VSRSDGGFFIVNFILPPADHFCLATKVAKKALEKILVILSAFHIFVVNTEAVPPSLKFGIPY
jgi:hypothetical protein